MNTLRIKDIIKIKKSCETLPQIPFKIEKPALISKSNNITKCLKLLKVLDEIKEGDMVLIKPNINSDDKFPGTSRPESLIELIRLLKSKGAIVTVGDMSSVFWSHTKTCSTAVSIAQACKQEGVPLVYFDDKKWIKKELSNTSLKTAYYTEELCNHKFLINLCILKTHRLADFTLSMKNLMGCIHPRTRVKMHAVKLKERIAEFNLGVTPWINIIDGTKGFIEGGPDRGTLHKAGIVLASKDRVALDATGVRFLQELGSESLKGINPWNHPQIKTAVKLGLGVSNNEDIRIIS